MYELFARLLEERGLTVSAVANATGISRSAFSEWKSGRTKELKAERLQKIADFLGVPVSYFITGETEPVYYEDPATAELAQRMKDDHDFRLLFSAARDVSPETLQQTYDFLLYLKKKERGEE